MYYEDHFHPNGGEEDDYEFQALMSVDSEPTDMGSFNSFRKRNKSKTDSYKLLDKGYRKVTRRYKRKTFEVELYITSNTPGMKIRDAITGSRYNYLTGSIHEDQFFKIKYATGEVGNDSATLFFDSPEQYERHLKSEISASTKENWVNKRDATHAILMDRSNAKSTNVPVK